MTLPSDRSAARAASRSPRSASAPGRSAAATGRSAGARRTTTSPWPPSTTPSSSGSNWVDTAAIYGLGHGEEVVGRAVRALPAASRPLVFTKCGLDVGRRRPDEGRRGAWSRRRPSAAGPRSRCAASASTTSTSSRSTGPTTRATPIEAGLGGDAQAARRGHWRAPSASPTSTSACSSAARLSATSIACSRRSPHQPGDRRRSCSRGRVRTGPA